MIPVSRYSVQQVTIVNEVPGPRGYSHSDLLACMARVRRIPASLQAVGGSHRLMVTVLPRVRVL